VNENYQYSVQRDLEGLEEFVDEQSKLVEGKRAYWWSLWMVPVKFSESKVKGKDVLTRLKQLLRSSVNLYRDSLIRGVHGAWNGHLASWSYRLTKNLSDIERDLTSAVLKKGGKDDRIAGLKILLENLDSIQQRATKLKVSLDPTQEGKKSKRKSGKIFIGNNSSSKEENKVETKYEEKDQLKDVKDVSSLTPSTLTSISPASAMEPAAFCTSVSSSISSSSIVSSSSPSNSTSASSSTSSPTLDSVQMRLNKNMVPNPSADDSDDD